MVECACFYYEQDTEAAEVTDGIIDICFCGHNEDEHDSDGECRAMVEEV